MVKKTLKLYLHKVFTKEFKKTFHVALSHTGVVAVLFPQKNPKTFLKTHKNCVFVDSNKQTKTFAHQAEQELLSYFNKTLKRFDIPIDLSLVTEFQKDIYLALQTIPFGKVISYGNLASLAKHPGKARAVGMAMGKNPLPIIIPCHRVISASGKQGGWSGPPGLKEWLLGHEGNFFK